MLPDCAILEHAGLFQAPGVVAEAMKGAALLQHVLRGAGCLHTAHGGSLPAPGSCITGVLTHAAQHSQLAAATMLSVAEDEFGASSICQHGGAVLACLHAPPVGVSGVMPIAISDAMLAASNADALVILPGLHWTAGIDLLANSDDGQCSHA